MGDGDRRPVWRHGLLLAALACASPTLAGQLPAPTGDTVSPRPPTPAAEGDAVFPAAFFAPYNPVTAADMVARVPGFELRDGDDRRGFGATAGNLLINGERPSSKTVSSELLKRIPASNVLRIEVLAGTNAAVDVRGQSQIVNVVLSQAAKRDGATTYVLGARHIKFSDRIGWALQASRQVALAPNADLALDFQVPNLLGRGVNNDVLLSPSGAVTGTRILLGRPTNIGLQGSAALNWRATRQDSVNLNVQYAPNWNSSNTLQLEAQPNGALRSDLRGHTDFRNNFTAEIGGDWEHRFSPTLSTKLIVLLSNSSVDQYDRFEIFTAPASFVTRTQDRKTDNGERIARTQVKWAALKNHTFEFGGEGAFNFRDTNLDIVNQARGGPPVPVPLAVSDARVEEIRGEVFVTDIWTATPRLTIESGINAERSRISQTGDQRKERSFRFVKPRVTATFARDPRNTLRFSLVRDVAQLDFAEFSSAVDFVNTSATQGNPDLVPEKAWKSRVEWESRFAPRAAFTVALFADRVEDVHDLVVIGGFDAFGNIGDGSRLGAEVRATLPLAPIGLANAELRINGLYQRTRVTDPITGEKRAFSVPPERQNSVAGTPTLNAGNKDWAYVVNFRQNLPGIQSAYGAALIQWAGRDEYRRAETFHYVRHTPRLDLFFETTAVKPMTMRLFVNNLLVSYENRTRVFYTTDRTSVVQRIEERRSGGGPEASRAFGFQVSGRF